MVALSGLLVAFVVAAFSPLASPSPDGLEAVAERAGFQSLAQAAPFRILPDYTVPFISNPVLTTAAAVMLGTLVVFGGAVLVGRLAARRQPSGG